MNYTEQQREEAALRAAIHDREIWEIRSAVKRNDTRSEHHPKNMLAEIARLQALLREAVGIKK